MPSTSAVLFHRPGHPADPAPGQHNLIRPLLDLALARTSAQGAYVYRFEATGTSAWLAAWAGLAPHKDSGFCLGLADPTAWQPAKRTPVVLHEKAWDDWRFRGLAEFERHRFEGVVSVPLIDGKQPVGVVNFCRSRRLTLQPRDLSLLLNTGVTLANLLTGATVRKKLETELDQARHLLEDRKLVDRAKGLLQTRYQCTEEKAYFHIRHLSRQKRVPMRIVAAQVIETAKIYVVPRAEVLPSSEELVSGAPAPAASGDGLPPQPYRTTPGHSSKTGEEVIHSQRG
jgi:two-component system, response regulator PdtaR